MKKERKRTICRLVVLALIIGAFYGVCAWISNLFGLTEISRDELQSMIESTGVVGPLVYFVICALQVTFIPLPNAVTVLAGNYAFGTLPAFIYSYIGTFLGSMLSYGLGKWIGRRFAIWVAGSKERLKKWIKRLKGREFVVLSLMFFFPFFPDDVLCVVAGLFPSISWRGFTVLQLVTRATTTSATLLFMSGDVIPFDEIWGIVLISVAVVLCIVAVILCFKYINKINGFLCRQGFIKLDTTPIYIDTVEIQAIKEGRPVPTQEDSQNE